MDQEVAMVSIWLRRALKRIKSGKAVGADDKACRGVEVSRGGDSRLLD